LTKTTLLLSFADIGIILVLRWLPRIKLSYPEVQAAAEAEKIAHERQCWETPTTLEQLCAMMVEADLQRNG
jgi:GDP-D-mannose dehydratase